MFALADSLSTRKTETHRTPWRLLTVLFTAVALLCSGGFAAQPALAYYAPNCVNVVLRDPYWSQFRGIVASGGNASGIGYAFARRGFQVNNTPVAGSIVVWPAGYYGASRAGHVGVVAAVYNNGSVLVRHENWPFGAAEHFEVFPSLPGLQFVHPAYYAASAVRTSSAAGGTGIVAVTTQVSASADAAATSDDADDA